MDDQSHQAAAMHVASLAELIKKTPLILVRINAAANGGRLFLADPIRLLSDIQVVLTPEAVRALEETLGLHSTDDSLRHLYDDFKRDAPDTTNTVVINGILPDVAHHTTKHGISPGAIDA